MTTPHINNSVGDTVRDVVRWTHRIRYQLWQEIENNTQHQVYDVINNLIVDNAYSQLEEQYEN
jgi:hypothetical protein